MTIITIRAQFDKTKRRIMRIALCGFLLGVLAVILADLEIIKAAPYYAVLPGMTLFTLALFYANLIAFRCPRCSENWGVLAAMGYPSFFKIDSRIRYCPFCGCNVDLKNLE